MNHVDGSRLFYPSERNDRARKTASLPLNATCTARSTYPPGTCRKQKCCPPVKSAFHPKSGTRPQRFDSSTAWDERAHVAAVEIKNQGLCSTSSDQGFEHSMAGHGMASELDAGPICTLPLSSYINWHDQGAHSFYWDSVDRTVVQVIKTHESYRAATALPRTAWLFNVSKGSVDLAMKRWYEGMVIPRYPRNGNLYVLPYSRKLTSTTEDQERSSPGPFAHRQLDFRRNSGRLVVFNSKR